MKRLLFIIIFLIAVISIGIFNNYDGFYGAMAALVVGTPFFNWLFTAPVPIEYEYYHQKFVFTFKDRNYAEHFASLNHANVTEKG